LSRNSGKEEIIAGDRDENWKENVISASGDVSSGLNEARGLNADPRAHLIAAFLPEFVF